jgi:protein tyrosine/serine phosphatase
MLTFKQFITEDTISPSTEPRTMSLWHGGDLSESYDETISHKKGRFEYGPGLYLTTHYGTAKKYAKGSRKLYLITIRKGININDIVITSEKVTAFVNEYVIKSKRKDVMFYIERQIKNDKINAETFCNIIINNDAIKPSDTNRLRTFFIMNGIDYSIVNNAFGWHEKMIVLFDMKLIINKVIVKPKDKIEVFDLPTDFNER